MITKGIILGKKIGTNKYIVRIPYFESAGGSQSIFDATLSTNPSISEEYRDGDIVEVAFEDHLVEKVVIIGRLFILDNDEPRGYANFQNLNVSQSVTLPLNTTLGGVSAKDIIELVRKNYVYANIPDAPDKDGEYILISKVENGVKTYSWVDYIGSSNSYEL